MDIYTITILLVAVVLIMMVEELWRWGRKRAHLKRSIAYVHLKYGGDRDGY